MQVQLQAAGDIPLVVVGQRAAEALPVWEPDSPTPRHLQGQWEGLGLGLSRC